MVGGPTLHQGTTANNVNIPIIRSLPLYAGVQIYANKILPIISNQSVKLGVAYYDLV